MKLAEALILRADIQKRIEQLTHRIENSSIVQEGDSPNEDPSELLEELDRNITSLTGIITRINKTNSLTSFNKGSTIADALAYRDGLWLKRNTLSRIIESGAMRNERYSKTEVRFVSTIDINSLQKHADMVSKEFRELDTKIQGLNWTIDLI